jgi:hypothetical protein
MAYQRCSHAANNHSELTTLLHGLGQQVRRCKVLSHENNPWAIDVANRYRTNNFWTILADNIVDDNGQVIKDSGISLTIHHDCKHLH